MRQGHPFDPVFDENARILILGSFPSVKSRENQFYYGHAQNRFWKVLAFVLRRREPVTAEEKTELLLSNRIALWDVIQSCEITGSADNSIKNVRANDLDVLLSRCRIESIYANGRTAEKFYNQCILPKTGRPILPLPSTSSANVSYSLERLTRRWEEILPIPED